MPDKMSVVYAADFETTTDPNDCRVWGWGLAEIGDDIEIGDVELGTTLSDFFQRLSNEYSTVWFHNLRFDGAFILDKLLRNGYSHTGEYAKPGEFETLISRDGNFYSITVRWRNGGRTEFRDSLKKFPGMTVANIAETFGMPMSKLSIDYDEYRSPEHELTDIEREYIASDVAIVARALSAQLSQGMTRLTVGADSLAEFKRLTGSKMFRSLFPILATSMDADIRKAYRGGWTYVNPKFQGRVVGPGAVYDVNSLYPSVMYNYPLPYGEPVFFRSYPEYEPDYPLFVAAITFTAKLKPNHVPCIQIKGSSHFIPTEYVSSIDEPITMAVTNVDLELWQEHYDLDILSWDGGWQFRATTGLFNDYIDKWNDVKEHSTGGMYTIAKLHLNSLYGKFATNPNVTGKIPVLKNDRVTLVMGPEQTRDPVYTATGVFITAYARRITISAAQSNYDAFAYADTDSIHLLSTDEPRGIDVDKRKLGAWKREYQFEEALFFRAKTYAEQEYDGTMHVHIAGLPRSIAKQVRFEDLKPGKSWDGKLQQTRVPGGVVLVERTFTLDSLHPTV